MITRDQLVFIQANIKNAIDLLDSDAWEIVEADALATASDYCTIDLDAECPAWLFKPLSLIIQKSCRKLVTGMKQVEIDSINNDYADAIAILGNHGEAPIYGGNPEVKPDYVDWQIARDAEMGG